MQILLAAQFNPDRVPNVRDRIASSIRFATRTCSQFEFEIRQVNGRNCVAVASSNTHDSALHAVRADTFESLLLGYGDVPAPVSGHVRRGRLEHAVRKLNQCHGMFLYLGYNPERDSFLAYTTLTRQIPIYVFEGVEFTAISNSCIALAMLASPTGRPEYDSVGVGAMISAGLIYLPRTVFKGVSLVDTNEYLVMRSGEVECRSCDDTMDRLSITNNPRPKQFLDEVADCFVGACRTPTLGNSTVEIGLSGGKDSRLFVAGLKHCDVEVSASTIQRFSRETDDRDVVIAKQVADRMGYRHSTLFGRQLRSPRLATSFDPRAVVRRSLLMRDTITVQLPRLPEHVNTDAVGTDAIGSIVRAHAIGTIEEGLPQFSGLGGEVLRGGYASLDLNWLRYKPELIETPARLLKQKALGRLALLNPEIATEYEAEVVNYLSRFGSDASGPSVLEAAYLCFNIGRSGAAVYKEGSATGIMAQPFADNALLRLVLGQGQHLRINEHLHQELIRTLAPELLDIELAEYRWGRGDDRILQPVAPVVHETRHQHYPIFWFVTDELREEFHRVIEGAFGRNVVASSAAVQDLFTSEKLTFPSWATVAWRLYYMALLTSETWLDVDAGTRPITVDHGRPWFNMVREYRRAMSASLKRIRLTSGSEDEAFRAAELMSLEVRDALSDKFKSAEFFGAVHRQNIATIARAARTADGFAQVRVLMQAQAGNTQKRQKPSLRLRLSAIVNLFHRGQKLTRRSIPRIWRISV